MMRDGRFIVLFGECVQAYAAWLPCSNFVEYSHASKPVWDHVAKVWTDHCQIPIDVSKLMVMYQQFVTKHETAALNS